LNCIPGKSTLINGLIGVNLLESGVLPTTSKICIIRHESQQSVEGIAWKQADNMILGDVQEIKIDLPWLKNIAIVDTPGTNAIVSDHEHLTQQIIPRADLVLFVTSAERPMSDSGQKITIILYFFCAFLMCMSSVHFAQYTCICATVFSSQKSELFLLYICI
jgi:Dynamin family